MRVSCVVHWFVLSHDLRPRSSKRKASSAASDVFKSHAGTDEVTAHAVVGKTTAHADARLRIRDITGTATLVQGLNTPTASTDATTGEVLPLAGVFVLASTSTIEIQLYTDTSLSTAARPVGSGDVEVYSNLYLRKIA